MAGISAYIPMKQTKCVGMQGLWAQNQELIFSPGYFTKPLTTSTPVWVPAASPSVSLRSSWTV